MKTPEELNEIKNEIIALNAKLRELTEDELKLVGGGDDDYSHREILEPLHYLDEYGDLVLP